MIRVDVATQADLQPTQESTSNRSVQFMPASSSSAMAAAELAQTRSEAIEETMEGMSLKLGAEVKKLLGGKESKSPLLDGLERLLQQLSDKQSTSVNKLVDTFAKIGDADKIISQLRTSGMSSGDIMLLLMALQVSGRLGSAQIQKLRKALEEMLSAEGAELAILAAIEGLGLDEAGLAGMRKLYQHASRGEGGLAKWFDLLQQCPDRRKRIKVLLRALSEPLNERSSHRNMVKVVAAVDDLRRLAVFMSLEDHCNMLGRATRISGDAVMKVSLLLIEQSWVYPEWIEEQIRELPLLPAKRLGFLRRWRELVVMMPMACFRDDDQKELIEESMMTLLDDWGDLE
ncbi:HrpJ domain-containing protein [uncultured Shewanella sp.]|uniref:HrpJ domain-containing protein n=1 Tax=uncultured Shewanella sp. TaxID=173975 RepID=UPI0026239B72|nr:HrpJ domain-containing protein [uncultured Shewanella sp.]